MLVIRHSYRCMATKIIKKVLFVFVLDVKVILHCVSMHLYDGKTFVKMFSFPQKVVVFNSE